MLEELANISNTIDKFLQSFLTFLYAIPRAILYLDIDPLRGAVKLVRSSRSHVSSRVLLFTACCLAAVTSGGQKGIIRALGHTGHETSTVEYLITVVFIYIIWDGLAACAAQFLATPHRHTSRNIFRYTIAVGLLNQQISNLFIQIYYSIQPFSGDFGFVQITGTGIRTILDISTAYPAIVVVPWLLLRHRRFGNFKTIAIWLVVGLGTLRMMTLGSALLESPRVAWSIYKHGVAALETPRAELGACTIRRTLEGYRVEAQIAFRNSTNSPLPLSARNIAVYISPPGKRAGSEFQVKNLELLEGVVIVPPNGLTVVHTSGELPTGLAVQLGNMECQFGGVTNLNDFKVNSDDAIDADEQVAPRVEPRYILDTKQSPPTKSSPVSEMADQ